MPGSVFHVLSATTPDNTSYEIRPSHWNSAHSVSLNLVGSEVIGAFSNANGVSFATNTAGAIVGSVAPQGLSISAGVASALLASLVFSNANGVSFGLNGSTMTASASQPVVSNLLSNINVAASNSTQNLSNLAFGNANLVSFGLSGSTITASVSQTSLSFSNANNVSFTTVGSSVYASVSFPAASSATFTNSNNVSFTVNAGVVNASASFPAASSVTFSNSNNVSFGLNAGVLTATATYSQSVQTQNNIQAAYLQGNTAGALVSITSGTLFLAGGNNITLSQTGNTLVLSGANIGGAQTGISGVSASNSLLTAGTVIFSNANNVTFGLSGNTITASIPSIGGAQTGISGMIVSNTTYTSGTVSLVNANGISFGSSGVNGISASYTVPTQSNQTLAIYAGGNTSNASSGTYDARSLTILGLGDVSVGWSASSLFLSTPVGNFDSAGISNIGNTAGNSGLVGQSMIFAGTNNITLNQSTGAGGVATLYISGPTITQQTGLSAVQFSNTTFSSGTINFVNTNGFSFLASGVNSIIGSYTTPSVAGLISAVNFSAGTTATNATALSFSNLNNVSFGLSGNTITASIIGPQTGISGVIAGNSTFTSGTISFSNANGVTFGPAGANVISASYTVPSVAGLISAVNFSVGTTQSNLSNIVFSNANGVSFGLNNGTITASVPAVAGAQTGISGIIVSNATFTSGTVSLVNANGISFGSFGANQLSASYTVPTVPAQTVQPVAVSAANGSIAFSTLSLGNSNGFSFYTTNGSIVGSYTTASAANNFAIAAGTQIGSTGTLNFANGNGISFGMQGSSQVTASYTVPTVSNLLSAFSVSANGTTGNLSGIVFSNTNNITFGLSGSTLTASVAAGGQSNQSIGIYASGNTTGTSTGTYDARSLSIVGYGLITVGNSNGSLILSAPATTGVSQSIYVSGNTGSASSGTAAFGALSVYGAGNVSVGVSNSSLVISGAGGGGGVAFSAGAYSTTTGTVVFSNANNISFGMNNAGVVTGSVPSISTISGFGGIVISTTGSTIAVSYTGGGGGGGGGVALSAGTNSTATGTVVFSNSNNISFGMNTAGVVTGSVPAISSVIGYGGISVSTTGSTIALSYTGGAGGVALSAGSQSANSGSVIFSNANGVSFGMSGSSIVTASFSGVTQSLQSFAVSASNGSFTFNTLTLANSNNLSFYTTNGSLAASYGDSLSIYAGGANTTGSTSSVYPASGLSFSGAGIISVGHSNGLVVISAPATTSIALLSAGVQGLGNYAGSTGLASNQLVLVGGNNITLSVSTNVGSATVSIIGGAGGGGGGVAVSAGSQSASSGTIVFSNANGVTFGMSGSTQITASVASQSNQTIGAYLYGNSSGNSSGTLDARSFNFGASGALTFNVSAGSLLAQVPATSSLSATGALSISTNGSTVYIGAPAVGTNSFYDPSMPAFYATNGGQIGNGSLFMFPAQPANFMSLSQAVAFANISLSTSSNSSMAGAISAYLGLYTRTGSTLSLASSGSAVVSFSNTSNNSYSSITGLRAITIPFSASIVPGDYWVAFVSNTGTTNANWFTASNIVQSAMSLQLNGQIGQASSNSYQMRPGFGVLSTTTNALPASVAFTQLTGQGSASPSLAPYVNFNNFSV